jgi:hypothetical protein
VLGTRGQILDPPLRSRLSAYDISQDAPAMHREADAPGPASDDATVETLVSQCVDSTEWYSEEAGDRSGSQVIRRRRSDPWPGGVRPERRRVDGQAQRALPRYRLPRRAGEPAVGQPPPSRFKPFAART